MIHQAHSSTDLFVAGLLWLFLMLSLQVVYW